MSSRSLRKTATRAGVGSTFAVNGLALIKRARPARLDMPTAEVLRLSIDGMYCCFCSDRRTFKALSAHWSKAHDIDLQEVRDVLGVPRGYSFISEALRVRFSERSRRHYDPKRLRNRGGPRKLSAYGRRVNKAKLTAFRAAHPEQAADALRRARQTNSDRAAAFARKCIECGGRTPRNRNKYCSIKCRDVARRRESRKDQSVGG